MNYTIEQEKEFQILGVSRPFHAPEAMKEIPAFWDEYFQKGCGEIACGQFAFCFDEKPDGNFRYAIGNHCTKDEKGVYHIFNRPDRERIPEGFELLTVPSRTWLKVECLGPLPQSIQGMHPVIQKEWPSGWERVGGCELEEYGYCTCPEDAQKADYRCFIWIPVRRKSEILSLREHPEMLEKFISCFASHWGHEKVYRDCMTAALTTDSPLPHWFLSVTDEQEIIGCAGLITNDFVSRRTFIHGCVHCLWKKSTGVRVRQANCFRLPQTVRNASAMPPYTVSRIIPLFMNGISSALSGPDIIPGVKPHASTRGVYEPAAANDPAETF